MRALSPILISTDYGEDSSSTGKCELWLSELYSLPFFAWKTIDLPAPYVIAITNRYRGHQLQESIVQAICLASQTFPLKSLDKCDLDEPGGLIETPFSVRESGFCVFHAR